MKNIPIPHGIWPTMMVPMHEDMSIDFEGVKRLLAWYGEQGAHGVFALCYSSEIRMMTLEERLQLMRCVADNTPRGMGLVASGHVADSVEDQIEEFRMLLDNGAPALVLIANRLAGEGQTEDDLLRNADRIMNAFPDTPLGIYECPYPYYRLVTPETLAKLARTGRFVFMKDTCCDMGPLSRKLELCAGTNLGIFNANAATLVDSWEKGSPGFSGIMCNFHTDLYVRMWDAFQEGDLEFARMLQNHLGMFSCFERMSYPLCAKIYQKENLGIGPWTRLKSLSEMKYSFYVELEQLRACEEELRETVRRHDAARAK